MTTPMESYCLILSMPEATLSLQLGHSALESRAVSLHDLWNLCLQGSCMMSGTPQSGISYKGRVSTGATYRKVL